MTERNYGDFAFRGQDTTLTHEELLAERQIVRMPTGFSTDTAEQRLSVARMIPDRYEEKGEAPIVCLPAFSDQPATRMDDSAAFRKLQANVSGRVIYTVNAPGVDMKAPERDVTSHTTPEQREELRRGIWCKTGRAVLNAVRAADRHFNDDVARPNESYLIHGSSQAAAFAMGLVAGVVDHDDRSFRLEGAAVVEPVNLIDRSPLVLGRQFMEQDMAGYIEQNPASVRENGESMPYWLFRTIRSGPGNLRYGRALARRDPQPLGDLNLLRESDVSVLTSRGTASELCDEGGYGQLVYDLGAAGVRMTDLLREP